MQNIKGIMDKSGVIPIEILREVECINTTILYLAFIIETYCFSP